MHVIFSENKKKKKKKYWNEFPSMDIHSYSSRMVTTAGVFWVIFKTRFFFSGSWEVRGLKKPKTELGSRGDDNRAIDS